MADFINTIDALGDDAVIDSIINRTITEFKDDTIETVGKYAFYRCTALETLHLPNATMLDEFSLGYTDSLTDIELPKVTTLGKNSFAGCGVVRLKLPSVVTAPGWVFSGSGSEPMKILDMPKLESIGTRFLGGNFTLKALLLRNTAKVCTIADTNSQTISNRTYCYVPRALVDSYKAATNWSNFAANIRALEDYTVDGTVTGELDETKI